MNNVDQKEDEMFKWVCKKWEIMFLSFALLLCFAISAEADIVQGQVHDRTGQFQPGYQITIKDQNGNIVKTVTTDAGDGSYRVFLPPCSYIVEFRNLRGLITSYPNPYYQDIYLER